MVTNTGAKKGDKIILTKILGVGIVNTALKGGLADEESVARATECMATLNRKASELMLKTGVNACTDITGFGLLGHACEMIDGTDTGMVLESTAIPYIPQAKDYAIKGLLPGGLHRNRQYRGHMVEFADDIPEYISDILFDPQTSGGLLIALAANKAEGLLAEMHAEGIPDAAIIGEITGEPAGKIVVR